MQLKESSSNYDQKLKDKLKYQEKLEKYLIGNNVANMSILPAHILTNSEYVRMKLKLDASDAALGEASNNLNIISSHFVAIMPGVVSSIVTTGYKCKVTISDKLLLLTNIYDEHSAKFRVLTHRLRCDLLAVNGGNHGEKFTELITGVFDSSTMLQLNNVSDWEHVNVDKGGIVLSPELDATTENSETPASAVNAMGNLSNTSAPTGISNSSTNLEREVPEVFRMTSTAMAALAATSPSVLPKDYLTPKLLKLVNSESCVWFNAVIARLYRDISLSDPFHKWLCALIARLLNKAPQRPDYIEEFTVEDVKFGGLPPLVTNIRWVPGDAKKHSSNPHAEDGPGPNVSSNKPAFNFFTADHNPNFDVNCEADLTFRSGIQFSLSTRIWINFPTYRYTSIPVLLKLNVEEVGGSVRFGFIKNACFLSFLSMPYTRIRGMTDILHVLYFDIVIPLGILNTIAHIPHSHIVLYPTP